MNELQRINYLEALGIQQWIAKAPLPNAKESEFVSLSEVEDVVDENKVAESSLVESHQGSSQEDPPELIQDLGKETTPDSVQAPQLKRGEEQEADQTLQVREPQKQTFKEEQGSTDTLANKQTEQSHIKSNSGEVPACAFQIQGKRGQYLLFCELQDKLGKMNTSEQNLIHNIAKAIDSIFDNASTSPVMPEQFKWPMFESHFKAEHIDQGENAAKEGIRAFLHSSIKKHVAPMVIILGEQAQYFSGINSPSNDDEGMIDLNTLANTRFIVGASLSELASQGNQSLKAELWKKILQYIG